MAKTVLVIVAHPDDEIMGGGGTLRRHVLEGDSVHALIVCEGESMRYQGREVGLAEQARRAADFMGFSGLDLLGFRDQHLDGLNLTDLIRPLEEILRKWEPEVVYTHFLGDLNRDHRMVAEATLVACRPLTRFVGQLLGIETPSSTEWGWPYTFSPNHFVDISLTLEDKLQAMGCYPSEVGDGPHPRALESLRHRAHFWGSWVMMEAAEPFVLYRQVRPLRARG
jgi:LmbE family N-acetylglucosaminyl deacetylase